MALGLGSRQATLRERGTDNMWIYQKQLQHPVKIERPNPRLASVIITALGGPNGGL